MDRLFAMDLRHPSRLLLECEATAFAANDTFACRTTHVGLDGITLLAAHPRKGGEFVRIQCCLEPGHWLDADTVLDECVLEDGRWIWSLSFVNLSEHDRAELDDILHRHRIALANSPPSSLPTQPAPPPTIPPSERRPSQLRVRSSPELDLASGKKSLKELYLEALHEVDADGKIIATNDAIWQARNWARRLG